MNINDLISQALNDSLPAMSSDIQMFMFWLFVCWVRPWVLSVGKMRMRKTHLYSRKKVMNNVSRCHMVWLRRWSCSGRVGCGNGPWCCI